MFTTVKELLPLPVRNALRYLTHTGYRAMVRRQRARGRQHRLVKEASSLLWELTGGRIASGPFRGMHYSNESVGSEWAPKLLGTYELELWAVVEQIVKERPRQLIDIGAGEGYYAAGLAWRIPNAHIVAFEAQSFAHPLMHRILELNSASGRVEINGICTPEILNCHLRDSSAVIICDVEGAELAILDPSIVPGLLRSDILVELHEWHSPQLSETIRQRFEKTHQIETICSRRRTLADLPLGMRLSPAQAKACMDEFRPGPMAWFWMTCR